MWLLSFMDAMVRLVMALKGMTPSVSRQHGDSVIGGPSGADYLPG